MSGVSGWTALASRILVSWLRQRWLLADGHRAVDVRRLWAKTSATAGTIFHRSHTPLSTWFAAIWFVTSQKNGVSARGLQDALGFGSYETAWAWLHKLRRAMVRPERELLRGVVELDQSFLGGRSHGRLGGSTEKAPITIAVERLPSGRLGRGAARSGRGA